MTAAVAPLVQPVAGGIEQDGDLIFKDGELDLIFFAGLAKPADAIGGLELFDRRFFDDGLTVGDAGQLGTQRPTLDRESTCLGNDAGPIDGVGALEQIFEAGGGKLGQLDEHPLGTAQAQICFGHGERVAAGGDFAVVGHDVGGADAAQLEADDLFQAKNAGADQCIHVFARPISRVAAGAAQKKTATTRSRSLLTYLCAIIRARSRRTFRHV